MQPVQEQQYIEISDGDDEDFLAFDAEQHFLIDDYSEHGPSIHNHQSEDIETLNHGRSRPNAARSLADDYQACLHEILDVFPDVSHDHVQQLYNKDIEAIGPHEREFNTRAQRLIETILDHGKYPKEKDRVRELKRKRNDKELDEEEAAKWKYMDLRDDPAEYAKVSKLALQEVFEFVPAKYIAETFKEHGHYYGSFFAILKADQGYESAKKPQFTRLKTRRVNNGEDAKAMMGRLQAIGHDFETLEKEMDSAFQRKKREDAQRQAAGEVERAEEAKEQEHLAKGEVMDCGCCCETVIIPKLTHCNGETPHFFCLDCARRNANNDIGNTKYRLCCMDFSGCKATFSREQRLRFLDEKTIEKLERLQQQEEIRLAELDNLVTCPFCDFAAICPPIEVDREFRCHNPQCEEVSCRICKLKSHIPLTCEQHKSENGVSERRIIEEARTEALVRTCSKCKVRILKEDGCNKVICTSCSAVLCDYCGKDITKAMYNHFDGEGGRAPPGLITVPGGKCPLYDESNKRKDQQVDAAEKAAMAKVRSEHPELSEDDLRIKFAKVVQQPSTGHRGHHGMYGENGFGLPQRRNALGPDFMNAAHPFVENERPWPLNNNIALNALGPAVDAAVRPAVFGAMNGDLHRQAMDAAPNNRQAHQPAQQQQAAYQRYMGLQQRQQQMQQQIHARLAQQQRQLEQQAQHLQQEFQAIQRAQAERQAGREAERQARMGFPPPPYQDLDSNVRPDRVDGAWSPLPNSTGNPFAFDAALNEANEWLNRPVGLHQNRHRPNRGVVENGAHPGQPYQHMAAARWNEPNAMNFRGAGEQASRETIAQPQPRPAQPPGAQRPHNDVDSFVNYNPWLQ